MKYWLATLIGGFCSANVIVIATSTWQGGQTLSPARIVQGQEPASVKVNADEKHTNDPDRVLFDGWEKPEFALLISGRLDGYIEPCGCTGLANQKGGLLRRHTLLNQLTIDKGWSVVSIDTGNQINRTGPQAIIKLKTAWRGLFQTMGYQAASVGVDDLKVPLIELIGTIERLDLGAEPPFICANVSLYDGEYIKPKMIIEIGGRKVGLTSVLGDTEIKSLGVVDEALELSSVDASLPKAIAALQSEKCDLYVLIANTSLDEGRKIAAKYPAFDVVISANGAGDPTNAPEKIESNGRVTSFIQVGQKGMHVGVLGFYSDNGRLVPRYQRVPLDARFLDSDEMKVVFKDYQTELGRLSLKELGIEPKPHPTGRTFVGTDKCAECHDPEYTIWEEGNPGPHNPKKVGPHSRATLDLTDPGERTWVTREKDPECLSCHVTGWNPQGFFPFEKGFTKIADAEMHGSGCENCHGPGSKHVEVEEADPQPPIDVLQKHRQEMVVTLDQARKDLCFTCHDLDNSPEFNFDTYWPKIKHAP